MTDNDKNKKTSDGWDPTEYEIYLSDEEEKEEEPQTSDAPVAEASPEKKPHKKKNKKAVKAAVAVILAVVILLALGAAAIHFFGGRNAETPNNSNEPQATPNTVRITFPEGYTVYQMGQLLEQNGVCTAEAFYTAANTPFTGIEIKNADERAFLLEGYLFPDTYDFYLNESADSVIKRFTDNFNAKITDEYIKKAESLGYSFDEMLTLASIIQKECDFDIDECKNVSSVFHNRLKASKSTYLGSDVTYFYLKNMADYLGGADSENFDRLLENYYTYSPYRKGLPAGPICNPGIKAIEAALNPNDTDYQFFLTDKSGTKFYYASTYEQHLKNGKEAGLTE